MSIFSHPGRHRPGDPRLYAFWHKRSTEKPGRSAAQKQQSGPVLYCSVGGASTSRQGSSSCTRVPKPWRLRRVR